MACLIGASTAMLSTTWPDGRTPVQLRNSRSALTWAERGLGERTDERAVVAPEDAAEHDQPDASVVAEFVQHGQIGGDDGDRAAAEPPRHQRGGGADVQQHHRVVGHQRGGPVRHALLELDAGLGTERFAPAAAGRRSR